MVIEKIIPQLKSIFSHHKDGNSIRILFVCLGNICRSPAAEGVMKTVVEQDPVRHSWVIDSAGTGGYHIGEFPDNRMRVHARRRGLELTHRCRKVSVLDFEEFDIIIGMDASNLRNLKRLAPTVENEKKIMPMSAFFSLATRYDHVPDPYYEGAEGFELVLDLLDDACLNLRDSIDFALGD